MLHHSHRSCRRPSPYRFPPYLASSHSSVTGSLPKDVRAETSAAPASGTSFVLVGATGSLAKKYLWQAVFELHLNMPKDNQLNVWAAARAAPEDGEPAVRQVNSHGGVALTCSTVRVKKSLPRHTCLPAPRFCSCCRPSWSVRAASPVTRARLFRPAFAPASCTSSSRQKRVRIALQRRQRCSANPSSASPQFYTAAPHLPPCGRLRKARHRD